MCVCARPLSRIPLSAQAQRATKQTANLHIEPPEKARIGAGAMQGIRGHPPGGIRYETMCAMGQGKGQVGDLA